ncbi:hypothetical protein DTO282F9_3182 [Paecilomyces variotii]|nr:hypothetical protein DTO282E5_3474 [Paecilomyces variotii]KAJ9399834.1 hypothetical protein DTO282F9_3182 [Paecilomyces variotii]
MQTNRQSFRNFPGVPGHLLPGGGTNPTDAALLVTGIFLPSTPPMPPNLGGPLRRNLSRLTTDGAVFYCPSCATWRRTLSTTAATRAVTRRDTTSSPSYSIYRRPASTLATSSAINASKNVPPQYKDLYDALDEVREAAAEQVNLSRLQLAQRGLESETPVIRIAVLGLNDAVATRRLVRLLLADPLKPREEWEDFLESYEADTSRGLLIRYGEESETLPNDLVPTISVPSRILQKGNIEILVSSLGASAEPTGVVTADTFLVPTVTIRTSHSGRHNFVRYPVHRSLLCGRGVDGFFAYSRLISRSVLGKEEDSVHAAVDLSVRDNEAKGSRFSFVDIDQAEKALEKFRESVQNATEYERGWNASGVQPLVDWLALTQMGEKLDPSLRTLIESLLDAAEEGVQAKEAARARREELETGPDDEVRDNLDRAVSIWAERAHTELRDALGEGFASKRWRGLSWWKLFWRVDDVGMITTDILEKKYLPQAEKEVIWAAGKLQQAGLLDEPHSNLEDLPLESVSEGPETGETVVAEQGQAPVPVPETASTPPWPTLITTSRMQLLDTTVPSLQALAQRLVLFSVSTSTMTSALSGLIYISTSATSLYEACTVAAVGLIYSLRRQETKWEAARHFWEEEVREEGRTALKETEQLLRTLVREGGKRTAEADEEDVSLQQVKATIERARKALEDVK